MRGSGMRVLPALASLAAHHVTKLLEGRFLEKQESCGNLSLDFKSLEMVSSTFLLVTNY